MRIESIFITAASLPKPAAVVFQTIAPATVVISEDTLDPNQPELKTEETISLGKVIYTNCIYRFVVFFETCFIECAHNGLAALNICVLL